MFTRSPHISFAVLLVCTVLGTGSATGQPDFLQLTPVIGVNRTSIDFGECLTIGQGADELIEVFNNVNDPTSILTITELTAAPGIFTLVNPPSTPLEIPGDGTRVTLTVRLTPPAVGLQTGTLTITAPEATNSPRDVSLSGVGNAAPTCDANGPYFGNEGEPVSFDGTASTDPGDVITYQWDYGDGGSGTGATPTHTYQSAGQYTVTLEVTDTCGVTNTCTSTADINATPVCSANGPYSGNQDQPIQFDGSGSTDPDGDPLTYAWDFGDGSQGSGPTPTHTYTDCGPFTVSLTVTDPGGLFATCTSDVDVNCPPICNANGPYNGIVGQVIQFDGTGSTDPDGDLLTYAWDFGDGGQGTGPTPTHTYNAANTYTVQLCVTDPDGLEVCCTTSAIIGTEPNEPPVCDAGGPYSGTQGQPVSFDGSNSTDTDGTIVLYDWDFGDGSTAPDAGPTPSHTYANPGTYTVQLCVTDDDNAQSCCTTDAVIEPAANEPPVCDAGGPYTGTQGQPVSFDGSNSTDPDGTIVRYDWDFGDGMTAPDAGPTPSHTYTNPGTYTVELCVTDDDNAEACCTASAVIEPAANQPPECDAGGPYTGMPGEPVSFDASNSTDPDGTIVRYDWEFGDGMTAPDAGPTPSHTYTNPGSYMVELCVTDDGNATTCCTTTARIGDVQAFACPRSRGFWLQQCRAEPGQPIGGNVKLCYETLRWVWGEVLGDCSMPTSPTFPDRLQIDPESGFETRAELCALNPDARLAHLCAQLDGPRPMSPLDMTEAQFLALSLNVNSGALDMSTEVDLGALFQGTVQEALLLIVDALNTGTELGRAMNIAEAINNGYGFERYCPAGGGNAVFDELNDIHCLAEIWKFQAGIDGAQGSSGLPAVFTARIHPNPNLRGSTTLEYGVTREMGPSRVEISVYDVSGRLVRTLESGLRTPGNHAVEWDLRDAAGARVTNGIYFIRLAVGAESATLKQLVINR